MDRSGLAQQAALLEREHEVERVHAALSAVGRRAGGTLVIEGAAGLGKSRLLEAARSCAPDLGVRVLGARATELEHGFSFGVVRQLFERPLLEADDRRARTLARRRGGARHRSAHRAPPTTRREARRRARPQAIPATRGSTACTGSPRTCPPIRRSCCMVDDLQWCDAPSASALGVHRAPARRAAARADHRHAAARSRADARGGDAGRRPRHGAAAPGPARRGGDRARWSPPACRASPTIASSAPASRSRAATRSCSASS